MKTTLVCLLALACSETPRHYPTAEDPDVRCRRFGTCAVNKAVADVDARAAGVEQPTKHHKSAPQPEHAPFASPYGKSKAMEMAERYQASQQRQTAVEADVGDSRTYVVKPTGERPPPRWEVEALTRRCSSRPTAWARERCMADN